MAVLGSSIGILSPYRIAALSFVSLFLLLSILFTFTTTKQPPILFPRATTLSLPTVEADDVISPQLNTTSLSSLADSELVFEDQNISQKNEGILEENVGKECDLYLGEWVRDERNEYPIYIPGSCPYVDEGFNCQSNGRVDSEYLKWRWQPHAPGCVLPRFNATDFLRRLRGKKLMLVGDSMNRNQFESLLCLLREGLTNKSKMYEVHGYKIAKGRGYYLFKFEDYNCTVEFQRSHFLVREGIRISSQGNSNPTLSIDQIDKSAARWKRADILVFNTGHWWTHGKTARGSFRITHLSLCCSRFPGWGIASAAQPHRSGATPLQRNRLRKNYYKEGDYIYPQFDAVEAYRRALKTWANWIDKNLNPREQSVFYRGYSSAHFRGGDWDSGGTCNGETRPILEGIFLDGYPLKMKIVDEVIQDMEFPVVLLNVTWLTNFRKDAHPSVYGNKNVTIGKRRSARRQDCSHWCLPGVPDAWNELIYAILIHQQKSSIQL